MGGGHEGGRAGHEEGGEGVGRTKSHPCFSPQGEVDDTKFPEGRGNLRLDPGGRRRKVCGGGGRGKGTEGWNEWGGGWRQGGEGGLGRTLVMSWRGCANVVM